MANLSALIGGGGLKSVTEFSVSSPTVNSNFSATVDITSAGVSDTAKTVLVLSSTANTGTVSSDSYVALKLTNATTVSYAWATSAATGTGIVFQVVEFN